jgi:hypothetical protein
MASVLWVRANPTGDDDPLHGQGAPVALDGYFEIERVPAGSHRFTVSLNSGASRVDLLSIENVTVRPGEMLRDPRLADVDLAGRVHLFELELASTTGELAREGLVWFAPADGAELNRYAQVRAGHATIASDAREIDVHVNVPGYRLLQQRLGAGRIRIELEAGLELALRAGSAIELDPGFAIEAVLRAPRGPARFEQLRVRVPREGAHTRVPFDGEWTIGWMLVDREKQGDRPLRSTTVDVRDDGVVREAVLDFTRADLDAAIERFGPKKKR